MNLTALRADFFGGVTAAIVALPLAIAFGVSSGAGALAGLYGAAFAGFFAALFGGTRMQVTGPTGPMTVVMALIVTHFHDNISAAFTIVTLAGLLQILFGKLGIGRFIKLVPQPVISGFMSGIGVIIIIVQIAPLLGQPEPTGTVLQKLLQTPELLPATNWQALLLGAASLAIMLLTPSKIARLVPPPLIALLLGSLAAPWLFASAPVIGEVPSGLPDFHLPTISLSELPYIVRYALVLALLGSIDSLLTSLVADSITRTQHDSNRELIGQGIGNAVSGCFGGLPAAGATMRTLVNIRAGGHSPVSGALHSAILLAILLGFGSIVSNIPLAVLAGILIKVGIDIIDWPYLKRIRQAPKAGVIIMLTTLGMTVFVDLMTAVAVGFVMAAALFVSRMADAQVSSARFIHDAHQQQGFSAEEQQILQQHQGRIVLFHLQGPLSFGSARDITRKLLSDVEKDVLAVDLSEVPFIDSSASFALEEAIQQLSADGDQVMLFGARENVIKTLEQTGVLSQLGRHNLFDQRLGCLQAAAALLDQQAANTPSEAS